MRKICPDCKTENLDYAVYCQNCGNKLNKSNLQNGDLLTKNRNWRIINSLWIVLTFTLAFNWIAFLYVGLHVRQKKWILSSIIYIIPTILLIASFIVNDENLGISSIFLGIVMGIISIIHAFYIRKEYLIRLESKSEKDIERENALKRKLKEENKLRKINEEIEINRLKEEIASNNHVLNSDLDVEFPNKNLKN